MRRLLHVLPINPLRLFDDKKREEMKKAMADAPILVNYLKRCIA
jgi:hypothetical protein